MLTDDIKEVLNYSYRYKTLFITIGNRFRRDDGVGPYIYENIKNLHDNFYILNAEDKPENIIDDALALQPDKTIIIDTANFNGVPGEARLLSADSMTDNILSTHRFPPKIIAKIIEKDIGSPVIFLGIQPKDMNFGDKITEEVKQTADEILDIILNYKKWSN